VFNFQYINLGSIHQTRAGLLAAVSCLGLQTIWEFALALHFLRRSTSMMELKGEHIKGYKARPLEVSEDH
jgi:hypothetical protein